MNPLGDSDIEELIISLLRADSRVDEREVTVRVDDGVVRIVGTVDSAAELHAALEVAKSAPGVRSVVSQLVMGNFAELSDDELRASVHTALLRDLAVDSPGIGIEARGGVVTLTGKVDSYHQKSAAENVAWWTRGVIDVISYLTVDGAADPIEEGI